MRVVAALEPSHFARQCGSSCLSRKRQLDRVHRTDSSIALVHRCGVHREGRRGRKRDEGRVVNAEHKGICMIMPTRYQQRWMGQWQRAQKNKYSPLSSPRRRNIRRSQST
ncbi:unnamed protein product [Ectocarpus sp. 4 AP-2014]